MTEDQKKRLWRSLSDQGRQEFKDNLTNCVNLIKRFDLIPYDDYVETDNQVKKTQKPSVIDGKR